MTCTAASHQGAAKRLWLHFWGRPHVVHRYLQFPADYLFITNTITLCFIPVTDPDVSSRFGLVLDLEVCLRAPGRLSGSAEDTAATCSPLTGRSVWSNGRLTAPDASCTSAASEPSRPPHSEPNRGDGWIPRCHSSAAQIHFWHGASSFENKILSNVITPGTSLRMNPPGTWRLSGHFTARWFRQKPHITHVSVRLPAPGLQHRVSRPVFLSNNYCITFRTESIMFTTRG